MPGFAVDEGKLRIALPTPTSSTGEDLKWSSAVFGLATGVIAWVGFVVWLLLRELV